MKTTIHICALFALFIASPLADAIQPARSARTTMEMPVIAHIKHALGSYADLIVGDPRFVVDPSIFRQRTNAGNHGAHHPQRLDYDYVFNDWSRARGKGFLETDKGAFDREEELFGVPREFVNGILNIETQWGRNLGEWPVVTTLYTIAVLKPDFQKQGWAEQQLIAFLAICKKNNVDPFSVNGSRTGAFGYPQFEPTSYPICAVHCRTESGPPDLFDEADAICSIGNYLHRAGWGKSEASHRKALHGYIRDPFYAAAVLDYADLLAGRPLKHPRYQFFHPQGVERAVAK